MMEMVGVFGGSCGGDDVVVGVFEEEYVVMEGKGVVGEKKEVKGESVENGKDGDGRYGGKKEEKVEGYVRKMRESVEEGKGKMMSWVEVESGVFGEWDLVEEGVEKSEGVRDCRIEEVYGDGGYESGENGEFGKKENGMEVKSGKMEGGWRWEVIGDEEDGVRVREIGSGKRYEGVKGVRKEGWRKGWRMGWKKKRGWG